MSNVCYQNDNSNDDEKSTKAIILGGAEGGRQKEFDYPFFFNLGHFLVTFSAL